jgi:hypothetical protein
MIKKENPQCAERFTINEKMAYNGKNKKTIFARQAKFKSVTMQTKRGDLRVCA